MAKGRSKGDPIRISLKPESFQPPSGYKTDSGHQGHQKSFTSTREAHHRGHKIKVKTTYRIEIDDEPLTLHTMVMDDGTVHCHGLPNYSFPSAIDLVKSIINSSRLARYDIDELGGDNNHHAGHPGSHGATTSGEH